MRHVLTNPSPQNREVGDEVGARVGGYVRQVMCLEAAIKVLLCPRPPP